MHKRVLLCLFLWWFLPPATAADTSVADNALMRGDYAHAIEIFETLSDAGDPVAMTRLAGLYQRGEGVPRDIKKAVELYAAAAELGYAEAQFNLGNMYLLGEGVPQDHEWALTFYRLAAKQGHQLAARNMRELYRANDFGDGAAPSGAQAAELQPDSEIEPLPASNAAPSRTADRDSGEAPQVAKQTQAPLESGDRPGTGSARNKQTAIDAAAELAAGQIPASRQLPAGADSVEITDSVRNELEMDEAPAQSATESATSPDTTSVPMAVAAENSAEEAVADEITDDEIEAVRLARTHGINVDFAGDAEVQADPVATATTDPDQVAQFESAKRALASNDAEAAEQELVTLADAGHGEAALLLAELSESGNKKPGDPDAAMRWRKRAAELGNAEAQYQLAEQYMSGRGVAQDEAMAITLFRAAAVAGHPLARKKLRAIYGEAGLPLPDFSRPREPVALFERTEASHDATSVEVSTLAPMSPSAAVPLATGAPAAGDEPLAVPVRESLDPAQSQTPTMMPEDLRGLGAAESPAPREAVPILEDDAGVGTTAAAEGTLAASNAEPHVNTDGVAIHPLLLAMYDVAAPAVEPAKPADETELPGLPPSAAAPADDDVAELNEVIFTDAAESGGPDDMDYDNATPFESNTIDEPAIAPASDYYDDKVRSVESYTTASEATDVNVNDELKSIDLPATTSQQPGTETATAEVAPEIPAASSGRGFFNKLTGFFSRGRETEETTDEPASRVAQVAVATESNEFEPIQTEPGELSEPAAAPTEALMVTDDTVESTANDQAEYALNDTADRATTGQTDAPAAPTSVSDAQPGNALPPTFDDGKRALAEGDYARAAKIFTTLAEAGNAEAQAHLGYLYYIGEGVESNPGLATEWYRRAAVQGNRDAQYNLAVAYAFGEGVTQDDAEAVVWYRRAAEQGSAIAQYSLGMSYALGEGIASDDSEALKWYRLAAEQGYAAAQYNLAYGYRTGHGVDVDEKEAVRWFAAAAANGHASAQYSLGYMYRSGKGVERNINEAIRWYRLAAEQGHPDARADLASLDPGG